MAKAVAGIQPSVLRWARESLGLSVEDVAVSLKRNPSEVAAWESGDSAPSYKQLEDMAYRLYKRPLATFFLPKPPAEPSIKKEFRTLPDFELDHLAADTRYQLRVAYAFQISLKELNDGINSVPRKIFRDIKLQLNTNVVQSAEVIRDYLGISLAIQTACKSPDEALKAWRKAVEEAGVYVFKHAFKQKKVSGFCLVDAQFPLIYLNNSTSKTRQIFTLFHELAHLLLQVNAISITDESYIDDLPPLERRVERFCNALSAELLIPSKDFNALLKQVPEISDSIIEGLADHYCVSREAILRRLFDRGRVTQKYYDEAVKKWEEEAAKAAEPEGGNYYATQASYLGERYLRLVFGKHYQGKLSLDQVADYLGVRSKSVAALEAQMLRKAVGA